MSRMALNLIVGVAIGVCGLTLAHPKGNGEHSKVLASYDLKEKFDGKDATVTMVEVTIGPGARESLASPSRPGVRVCRRGHVRA